MASAVVTQHFHGTGNGGVLKDPPLTTLHSRAPPSPPATETDTETDSEPPNAQQGAEPPSSSTHRPANDHDTSQTSASASTVTSPITSPPYWMNNYPTHSRNISSTSIESIPTGGITLRDNENSSIDERGNACWAKSVEITDYVTVNGSTTNIGAFVVWNIKVGTLSGSSINIRKRYSEFDDFRWRLIRTFPNFEAAVPELPPKSLISKFRPKFLEKRRAGLQYFLNCILLNPEFSGSPVLKEFLFS
ncbi:Phox homologous domain-containing protein [Whalleya microplaca]|nr:Phox homologous domain-containing protein [Whalleya microplaca]